MTPNNMKETGLCDVYTGFSVPSGGKSDGWHGDIDDILAAFEIPYQDPCEIPR